MGQVVLTPGAKRDEVHAALHGELGAILQLVAQKNKSLTPGEGVRLSVVAGAGFGLCRVSGKRWYLRQILAKFNGFGLTPAS